MEKREAGPPIFVVSGGMGASGELLARTVLAQFRVQSRIVVEGSVNSPEDVIAAVESAAAENGPIVHSMVNSRLRELLVQKAKEAGVFAVDIAGPLIEYLAERLHQEPIGVPGLYRQQQIAYFRRVEAIEFTVAHDDGKRTDGLLSADIVIVGPSRCGKTPLSIYLSMLGWKVANVPIVPFVEPPQALSKVDKRRIVALQISPAQLIAHRKFRQQRMGVGEGEYTDRASVVAELREYNHFVQRHGFTAIDVTDKPVESTGEEIIQAISGHMPSVRLEAPSEE